MNPYLVTLLIAFAYIIVFGGLSLVRREGLSLQFALEVLGLTALALALTMPTGIAVNPIWFLVLIYLISMRVRLLADLANLLLTRGRVQAAETALRLALRLAPDKISRQIVYINQGAALLRQGHHAQAKEKLLQVLAAGDSLGMKHEAACRYNLAVAYQHLGDEAGAVEQFRRVVELMPSSVYGHAAERAIARRREEGKKKLTPGADD